MKKSLPIIVAIALFISLLFFPGPKTTKHYSVDKQYSVYARPYIYTRLLCIFSFMDCAMKGKLFLYDEVEKRIIGIGYTDDTTYVGDIKFSGKKAYYRGSESVNANTPWILPRPID